MLKAEDVLAKLRFKDSKLGYVKVSDGSLIVLRVAVVDVRVREEASPLVVEFDVNVTTGISVYPSEGALDEVRDRPVVEPGKTPNEGWVRVDIVEREPAYEEVVYSDGRVGRYLVRVEVEPLMVSKNAQFKTVQGSPLYFVRWVPKVSWGELREGPEGGSDA